MVGICGSLGSGPNGTAALAAGIPTHDDAIGTRYDGDRVSLWGSFHPLYASGQPAAVDGEDVLVWVWGDVYGYDRGDEYVPRDDAPGDSARYCAQRYAEDGLDCVGGLNGDFALAILDREAGTLSLATDRVATRPIYYTRPTDDQFVFASSMQALPNHPSVDPAFDTELLYEYLVLRRVFGVETPLEGVRELPPGSITTINLSDLSTTTETYWRPEYEPVDKSVDEVVAEISDTFQQVLSEWTDEDLDYGVFLSGGSDSRALVAGLDQHADAFHITDWMSRETQVAREVTEASGNEFHLLKRDLETDAAILEESPAISNFSGWFDQAYFATFEEEIRDEVDVLLSGLYADMLFGGGPLRTHVLSLGPVGNISVPIQKPVDSVDQYVAAQTGEAVEPVPYVSESHDIQRILRDRIDQHDGGVESHGVEYGSVENLVMYGDYYPMGADTDAIFSRSLMHARPYRTPFLDNRLLDLQRQIPKRLLLRRNLVHSVVEDLAPELAEIQHARTGVPLKYPFPVHFLGENVNHFQWKHFDEVPAPHLDHGPWPARDELIRESDFTIDTIRRNEDLLRRLPFLDFDGALECYDSHLTSTNNVTLLYSLLTLLEMPATERIATAADSPVDDDPLVGSND